MQYLELSRDIAVGDFIAYIHEQMATAEGRTYRYSFSGSLFFARMKEKNLYSTDNQEIIERISRAGLTDIYHTCLV